MRGLKDTGRRAQCTLSPRKIEPGYEKKRLFRCGLFIMKKLLFRLEEEKINCLQSLKIELIDEQIHC